MKQNQNLVLIEDFDLEAITKAFKEGRLYMAPIGAGSKSFNGSNGSNLKPSETPETLRAHAIAEILTYVSRIDACTSSNYRTHIRAIWEALLVDEAFSQLFFFTRYRSTRGKINWYRVNVLICLLREHHVYQSDRFTGVDLHLRCEQATRRNTHYTCMNRYLLEHREMVMFKRLLMPFLNHS